MKIKPFFQTATHTVSGDRVNYHNFQGKIKVQHYTDKGMDWITLERDDFANRYIL
jgi:hypothetical protein